MKNVPTSSTRFVLALKTGRLTAFLFLMLFWGCSRSVPDAKLKELFYGNRDDFNKLAVMSEQDRRVVRINFDFTILDTDSGPQKNMGLSASRWEEYRQLFRKLGITGGLERPEAFPSAVFFYAQCEGSAVDGDCKGFAYSEKPLLPVANSLNKPRPGNVFEPLSGNWYLLRWVS